MASTARPTEEQIEEVTGSTETHTNIENDPVPISFQSPDIDHEEHECFRPIPQQQNETKPTPWVPPTLSLLLLPPELRLQIYKICPVLTLLQLTHTSTLLRAEINALQYITRHSHGFNSTIPLASINAHLPPSQRGNLSIGCVKKFGCWEEFSLFQREYGARAKEGKGRRSACVECFYIRRSGDRRRNQGLWILVDDHGLRQFDIDGGGEDRRGRRSRGEVAFRDEHNEWRWCVRRICMKCGNEVELNE